MRKLGYLTINKVEMASVLDEWVCMVIPPKMKFEVGKYKSQLQFVCFLDWLVGPCQSF